MGTYKRKPLQPIRYGYHYKHTLTGSEFPVTGGCYLSRIWMLFFSGILWKDFFPILNSIEVIMYLLSIHQLKVEGSGSDTQ